MAEPTTHHGTIVFERIFAAPAPRVFAALSDPVARARWSAPSDTAVLIYDEADFRAGGRDIFRCGAKNDPRYRGETHYCDIVPNRRIVYTETVVYLAPEAFAAEVPYQVAIVTLENGSRVTARIQGERVVIDDRVQEVEVREGVPFFRKSA